MITPSTAWSNIRFYLYCIAIILVAIGLGTLFYFIAVSRPHHHHGRRHHSPEASVASTLSAKNMPSKKTFAELFASKKIKPPPIKRTIAQTGSCMIDSSCFYSYDEATCLSKGGVYDPMGVCPTGGCISPALTYCFNGYPEEDCTGWGWIFAGANIPCLSVSGTCCNYATSECVIATNADDCNMNIGGQFKFLPGPNPTCPVDVEPYDITAGYCQGMCCLPDGSCLNGGSLGCQAAGGSFTVGGICDANTCPRPPGTSACCNFYNETCSVTLPSQCDGVSYPDTGCVPNYCLAPVGACCIDSDTEWCIANINQYKCTMLGGSWTQGTNCQFACPAETSKGACCKDGQCTRTNQAECTGTYKGDYTYCSTQFCPPIPTGACCKDYQCSITTQASCSGNYGGDNSQCSTEFCPLPHSCDCNGDCYYTPDENTCVNDWGCTYNPTVGCINAPCASLNYTTCTDMLQEDCINAGRLAGRQGVLCSATKGTCCNYATGECTIANNIVECNNNIGGQFNYVPSTNPTCPIYGEPTVITVGYCQGSCCFPDGSCQLGGSAGCPAFGGVFKAGGTCEPNTCSIPQPTGSCCKTDGTCSVTEQSQCLGTWNQGGVCVPNTCVQPPPTGACCKDYQCSITTQSSCSGNYGGDNSQCSLEFCPAQPVTGSCCQTDGTCSVTQQSQCSGSWNQGGTCDPNICMITTFGACCKTSTGQCYNLNTANECHTMQGVWTENAVCSVDICPVPTPTGACCKDYQCSITTQSGCSGTYGGDNSQCSLDFCPAQPTTGSCCQSDGTCGVTQQSQCSGTWSLGGVCEPNICPQPPTGSCCQTDGTCSVTQQSQCSGSWNLGGVCNPNTCVQPPQTGACCKDYQCSITTQASCSGNYGGDNSQCSLEFCPAQPITGSCCQTDGTCSVTEQSQCSGTWNQGGVCVPNTCVQPPPTGACCKDYQCSITTQSGCSGNYGGDNSQCSLEFCPAQPQTGSCCVVDGSCTVTEQSGCASPSVWSLNGVCSPNTCPQPPATGSCCANDGTCAITQESQCTTKWTLNGVCVPNSCPITPITGSCCKNDGSCTVTEETQCTGAWTKDGTCLPNNCPQPPTGACCIANTGICYDSYTSAQCNNVNGVFNNGAMCSLSLCPAPQRKGACCMPLQHKCIFMNMTECTGTYLGDMSSCTDCRGACCNYNTLSCSMISLGAKPSCQKYGQERFNYEKQCSDVCNFGACCRNKKCSITTPNGCDQVRGTFLGGNCTNVLCISRK